MDNLIDCDNETAIAGRTDLTDCSFWEKFPDATLYQPPLEIGSYLHVVFTLYASFTITHQS